MSTKPLYGQEEDGEKEESAKGESKVFDGEEAEAQNPPPATSAPSSDQEEGSSHREYIVLVRDSSGSWKQEAKVSASSQDSAIRSLGEENLVDSGTYVAVPARSWRPTQVSVKRSTEIRIGQ